MVFPDWTLTVPTKPTLTMISLFSNLTKAGEKAIKTFNNDDDPVDYKKYPLPNDYNDDPISKTIFLEKQSKDSYCQRYTSFVPKSDSQITYDCEGYPVRISCLDGALQRMVPASLLKRVLNISHYPRLQALTWGHPGANRMNNTLRRDFYGNAWKTTYTTLSKFAILELNHEEQQRGQKNSFYCFLRMVPLRSSQSTF